MKKVMIYPFGKESEFIGKHCGMLEDLYPVCLAGLKGWDDGQRIYEADGRSIPVVYDFMEGLNTYNPEVIWFADFSKQIDFEAEYLPFIKTAVQRDMKIMMSCQLEKQAERYLPDIAKYYYRERNKRKEETVCGEFLKPINTPVVYLCGIYGNLCKYELQLMLRKELQKRGISFVQIGTKDSSKEFGFLDIPWFMTDESISDKNKTLMFNRYIKEVEEKERPDMIVAGIPGEMCTVTDTYVAGFGYLAKDYFYGVHPDVVVMTLPYGQVSPADLDGISQGIANRYGAPVDIFCRTNRHLLLDDTESEQDFTYLTVNRDDKRSSKVSENLFDLETEQMPALVDELLARLKLYGRIESV